MKNQILIEGCLNNKISQVEERIRSSDRIDEFPSDGSPALSITCYFGYNDISRLLIMNGAKVNLKDKDWMTPLHYAAMNGKLESMKLLLGSNADPSLRDKMWRTPLHISAAIDNVQCLELIMSKLRIINAHDRMGWSALHYAAWKGHINNVKFLINKGLDIKHSDKKDRTPLHFAALNGHNEVVDLLISCGSNINAMDRNGLTPLHFAAIRCNTSICIQLVGLGANFLSKSQAGNIPLFFSCAIGDTKTIDFFTEKLDTKIYPFNKQGLTAIHFSCFPSNSYYFIMKFFNQKSLNTEDNLKRTPLHYLAYTGNISTLDLFTGLVEDVDKTDINGWTALHVAAYCEEVEFAIQLMHNYGANPNRPTKDGRTALHIAASNNNLNLISYLIEYGASKTSVDNNGCSPLHYAILYRSFEAACYLLEISDVDVLDTHGRNLLHYAAFVNNLEFVTRVIEKGLEINSLDDFQRSPLHYAASEDFSGQIVEELLNRSANLNPDCFGHYPLHYALYRSNDASFKLLLKETKLIQEPQKCTSILHILIEKNRLEYLPSVLEVYDKSNFPFDSQDISPVHLCVAKGDIKTLNFLLRAFSDKNIQTKEHKNNFTPIHFATSISSIECLKALLCFSSFPADINATAIDNISPFFLALISNSPDAFLKYLIKNNANVNISYSILKLYSIHAACLKGKAVVVDMLIKAGADVNALTGNGKSPAHFAAMSGSLASIKKLHENGGKLGFVDSYNDTPLHWACLRGYSEIVKFISSNLSPDEILAGSSITPLHCAIIFQNFDCLSLLLEIFEDVSTVVDPQQRTFLHFAACQDDPMIASLLVKKQLSLNCRDFYNRTPLHYAAMNHDISIMELFLTFPCDLSIVDNDGNTALHIAAIEGCSRKGFLIFNKMTEKEREIRNNEGKTASDISDIFQK